MLRITTIDIGEKVTLKLEGKLSGPWVEEFERCWHMSADIYKKGLVVDLTGVTFVDTGGKETALLNLERGGATDWVRVSCQNHSLTKSVRKSLRRNQQAVQQAEARGRYTCF